MTMPGLSNGYPSNNWPDDGISAFEFTARQPEPHHHKRNSGVSSSGHSLSNGYSSDPQSDPGSEDGPTYLLEHLATFSVGRSHNILKPSDGLDKLWQMEKKTGIWTQKMQMKLTRQWVVIIDFENGDIVERFPIQLISTPMAFTGTDPKELYNNILIFIVKEDAKNKNASQSEMHIFQCVQISAQDVVKDMNLFMSGKWKSVFKNDNLPPPPKSPAPGPPVNGMNMKRQASRYSVANSEMLNVRTDRLDSRASPIYNNRDSIDETSSTSSEKYEKEVGILNHCFDDIEQFIAWLQSAAAAYRELERRKKDRKSKKKDHGDGMLSMRAKPPPERDFVDVLQKFKLSFNLLAKLKAHIHDPNAPELVHFLFTPLALIIDASRDSNYGPNLASKVVSPLLTREAVELLGNCLTSKESDLWHSLGEAWVLPRDMWSRYVAPYHPTFRDGYSPEYPFSEERERAEKTASAAAAAALASRVQREDNMRPPSAELRKAQLNGRSYARSYTYDGDHIDHPSSPEDQHRSFNNQSPSSNHGFADDRSVISADSIENGSADPHRNFERQQQMWLEELKARGARVVEVIFPRTANNDKELTVYRGEYLQVLDSSRQWWKARNSRGQVAHVPNTIVTEYQMDDEVVFSNPLYAGFGRDLYRQPESPNRSTDGSASGDLPTRSAPPIPPPAPQVAPPPPDWKINTGRKVSVPEPPFKVAKKVDTTPKPEPVVPIITPISIPAQPNDRIDPQSAELLHEELKKTIGRQQGNKAPFAQKVKQSGYSITVDSTEKDVQLFLRAKAFDESIQKILSEMDGYKMYHLTPAQLEKYCGKAEGSRLNSCLMVEKSRSNYETMRAKELQNRLALRREKVDAYIITSEVDESSSSLEQNNSFAEGEEENRPGSSYENEVKNSYMRSQAKAGQPPPPPPPP